MPLPFTIIDLTHSLNSSIPTWDGHCGFSHQPILEHNPALPYSFRTRSINMEEGIGTHLDAPLHVIADGRDVASLTLEELIAPAVIIDVSQQSHERYRVSPETILIFEEQHGKIMPGSLVIIYTGWSRHWSTPSLYHNNHVFPSISASAAELLVHERQIIGLGIDTLSPDCPENDEYPVHNMVLGANKYIIENIANANLLPATGSYVFALPMKIAQGSEAPIRLIGLQLK
ncbi:cyclase family protein [Candidatus Berkiella aquae]|uniref:Cyclase family protein n=1 Tax=Candidatus Berkiella aquae TaxID=295108 RepID=A0AAE3HSS3_9GAMM|nr:cyclase family protein [Candidatus Berkiella aquae]